MSEDSNTEPNKKRAHIQSEYSISRAKHKLSEDSDTETKKEKATVKSKYSKSRAKCKLSEESNTKRIKKMSSHDKMDSETNDVSSSAKSKFSVEMGNLQTAPTSEPVSMLREDFNSIMVFLR